MLTRIRNAGQSRHASVELPSSRVKADLARVLNEAGYIDEYTVEPGLGAGTLKIRLRYRNGKHVITGIRRESTPGQRRYCGVADIPKVMNGFGAAVLTTSQGIMTGSQARRLGLGGELMCTVW
jgi:small subunit ribosomal protein S8